MEKTLRQYCVSVSAFDDEQRARMRVALRLASMPLQNQFLYES